MGLGRPVPCGARPASESPSRTIEIALAGWLVGLQVWWRGLLERVQRES